MKKLLFTFLFTLSLIACTPTKNEAIQTMNSQQAIELMKESTNYLIVDVRTKEEFKQGHIPEAINIDNEEIQKAQDIISSLPDKDQKIFIYCRSGNRSAQAANKLTELGYTDIIDFGGIKDWNGEIVTE